MFFALRTREAKTPYWLPENDSWIRVCCWYTHSIYTTKLCVKWLLRIVTIVTYLRLNWSVAPLGMITQTNRRSERFATSSLQIKRKTQKRELWFWSQKLQQKRCFWCVCEFLCCQCSWCGQALKHLLGVMVWKSGVFCGQGLVYHHNKDGSEISRRPLCWLKQQPKRHFQMKCSKAMSGLSSFLPVCIWHTYSVLSSVSIWYSVRIPRVSQGTSKRSKFSWYMYSHIWSVQELLHKCWFAPLFAGCRFTVLSNHKSQGSRGVTTVCLVCRSTCRLPAFPHATRGIFADTCPSMGVLHQTRKMRFLDMVVLLGVKPKMHI